MPEEKDVKKIIESLSPIERKIIPFLEEKEIEKIVEKSELDKTSVLRAFEFLSNKKVLEIKSREEKIIELGINGLLYKKKGLPERRLVNLIAEKNSLDISEAKKLSELSDNEFKAAFGVLKKKVLINIIDGKMVLAGSRQEIIKSSLEEKFLESLPRKLDELKDEEKYAFENLKSRKDIIEVNDRKLIGFSLTKLGKSLVNKDLNAIGDKLIEQVTPNLIKTRGWKGKRFRRYDIGGKAPRIYGGKRHFVNQAVDYAKKLWLEMGFKEMSGDLIQSSFWNFDALFTAQDHPVRELQDTFFIKDKTSKLPDKKIVEKIRGAHEGKIKGSKGWDYEWKEDESKKVVLRTHTTCLSARTLLTINKNKEFPAKYFALGKCFRNETVDWSHGFEFNQTEGIVVDENANFKQLLGYLSEFFKKMGYKKIRIRPGYFPYTEPSLEIDVFHPFHKKWVELGGAGMFRPEVTIPLFGKHIPVLAWGPGFDRIIMEFFEISDLRDMYKNDLNQLRNMKIWRR
ncbi:MAG: phenylalanine--tRNA ligase subunit alpha [Nanoarchaeota archaeon]